MTLEELRQLGYRGVLDEWYRIRCGSEAKYRAWARANGLGPDAQCYFFVAFICLRRFGGSADGAWNAANKEFRQDIQQILTVNKKASAMIAIRSQDEIDKVASGWDEDTFKV